MQKNIRLVAMDMDGTLLNAEQRVSENNAKALRAAIAQGVQIALCSGRMSADLSYFAQEAELPECHILGLNGACCLEKPHEPPYAVQTIRADALARSIETLRRFEVCFGAFQPNRLMVCKRDPIADGHWGGHWGLPLSAELVYGWDTLEKHIAEGVCKLVYLDQPDAPRIVKVREALLPVKGLQITSSWRNNLELMPESVCKGEAVRRLAERLNIPREQVMTLGDYDNDMSMIEYAGVGVAMGNASERVRAAADRVTLPNTQDGVAAAIERYVLN